jgi:hypothetical protein
VVAPIPTLPFCNIEKRLAPVEDAMRSGLVPALPVRERDADGVDDPTPTLPFASIEKRDVVAPPPVDEATPKIMLDDPSAPCIEKRANGVEVPIAMVPVEAVRAVPLLPRP